MAELHASAASNSVSAAMLAPLEDPSLRQEVPHQPPATPNFGCRSPCSRPHEPLRVEKGSKFDFYSTSQRRWIPCVVLDFDPETQAARLDVKPGQLLDLQELRLRLRPRASSSEAAGAASHAQLRRMRAALGDRGALRREAFAIFGRYARQDPSGADQSSAVYVWPAAAEALAEELDARLGVTSSAAVLSSHLAQAREGRLVAEDVCEAREGRLVAEDVCEVLRELLWGKPKKSGGCVEATLPGPGSDLAAALAAIGKEASHGGAGGAGALQGGLLEHVRALAAKAWEAVFRSQTEQAPEEDLRQLAEMGFQDRERCMEVLRRHGGRLSPLVFEDLFKADKDSSAAEARGE